MIEDKTRRIAPADEDSVTATIPFYNDAERRQMVDAVTSIRHYVDKVVAFDGGWLGGQASNTETLDYVRRLDVDEVVPPNKYECEMDKRVFENNYPGGWTFILDSDEVLLYGGEWIKRAVAFGDRINAYNIMMIDLPTGLTAHRRNLFRHGTFEMWGLDFMRSDGVEHLPILVGHKALGTFKLAKDQDPAVVKAIWMKAKIKGKAVPTFHRQNVWKA